MRVAIVGVACGLFTGALIIVFRLVIEAGQALLLPDDLPGNFEALSPAARLLLPLGGAILIAMLFYFIAPLRRQLGVVHVMERLAYHQGSLPAVNALVQFVGAAISLVFGQSVGREGPGIHLGAAAGSALAQRLGLPNNAVRTLAACGVAAAVAAGFNTPLAGVIFAMEVVMMEYTITGFAPVILSAVSATFLSRLVFGAAPAFSVPALELGSVLELPLVLAMGVLIGVLAAAFLFLLQVFMRASRRLPLATALMLAGAVSGLSALAVPQIMGVGYDTVNQVLLGEVGLGLMVGIVLLKLLATSAAIGLGLPGGLIAPTLVMGAAAGGLLAALSSMLLPGDIASQGFYALIGMGAMMAATLQAPLAALITMLELTANPNIILPGMLAVIGAGLVTREVFGRAPVYVMQMRERGLDYRTDPVSQTLHRVHVVRAMHRDFVATPPELERPQAAALLESEPRWILIEVRDGPAELMPAADLAYFLNNEPEEAQVNLLAIPARLETLAAIPYRSTLHDAMGALKENDAEALVITRGLPGREHYVGVLRREDIESYYRYRG